MERLTKRTNDGYVYLAARDSNNFYDEEVEVGEALDRLAELEDKIESEKPLWLPCLVGDEIYYITKNRITGEWEIADGKVSMVYQKADKTWHFRFSYRQQFARTLLNPKLEWGTFQTDCFLEDFWKEVFTDKEQAKAKLKELKGE